MLRPQAHADGAGGQALEGGEPVGDSHEDRRADQVGGIEDFFEQMLVQKNLKTLDQPCPRSAQIRHLHEPP